MAEKGSNATGVISNKKAAAGTAAVLRLYKSEGRQSAYIATFVREVSPQVVVGPVVIESSVVSYASATGAASGYAREKKSMKQSGWKQVSTGRLGEEAAAFTETKALDQTEYQSFVIDWRQANVVNQIRIAGNAATLDLAYALTLARVQQRPEARN
ncbi:MAG TPA: hypothetical protein VNH38_06260 [Candidatus Dormibacteraeota bacterium]|nr:hypothetical protein [Candidatus Dormibacteraeota bacterium]